MVEHFKKCKEKNLKTKFDIKIVHYFNREDFHPMPSVDCVLVYFKRKYKYDISKDE